MTDIVELARRLEGSALLRKVGIGMTTADKLVGQMADEIERLRAAPKVKPLEWEDHPLNGAPVLSRAVTQIGTYFICDDVDDFSGAYLDLVTHDNAEWWQHVRAITDHLVDGYRDDDIDPLKAAAQADYERRIRAALTQGGE